MVTRVGGLASRGIIGLAWARVSCSAFAFVPEIDDQNKTPPRPRSIWDARVPFSPAACPFFYGWVIVFAATLGALFSIPGQTMGFSVFTEVLMEKLGLTRLQLSFAYCVGTVASGLTLPRLGRALDSMGERRMGVVAAAALGLILFYLAATTHFARTLAADLPAAARVAAVFAAITLGFYMVRAAGQGVLSLVCRNAIGKWFDHRRGLATAISGVLVAFGYSIAPTVLDALQRRFTTEGAWLLMGVACIVVMAPLAWLLFRDTPEEIGLRMDGGPIGESVHQNPDMHIHREFTRDEAVRTYSFWIFNLTFCQVGFYGTAVTFHIISLGTEMGLARPQILQLFIPIAVVSVTTNLLFGAINSQLRLKWLLLVMNLGSMLAPMGLLFLDRPLGLAAYTLGSGIASGGFVSLSGIVFPRFFGRLHLGAISGMNMAWTVVFSGLGPLSFGWCFGVTKSYELVLILSAVVPAILLVMSLWADNPQLRLERDDLGES